MKFVELSGSQARVYLEDIAALRIKVFCEWPYLYDGNLDYERKYLNSYFSSDKSYIVLAVDNNELIVGAATAIWLPNAEPPFQLPFIQHNIAVNTVCYYGESVLLPEFRGRGIGREFMLRRERFAKSISSVSSCAFCAVIRDINHQKRDVKYGSLEDFWRGIGFKKAHGMFATFSWKDIGDTNESDKLLQFWIKSI